MLPDDLIKKLCILIIITLSYSYSYDVSGDTFIKGSSYEVCFTPSGKCSSYIISLIDHSKKKVLIQAYSFTDDYIVRSLIDAKDRGVDVRIILDKSQFKPNKLSESYVLHAEHVPIWFDYKVAIAHNKVIIIDDKTVITGSFNFTNAAQKRNAENLLVIHDKGISSKFSANWDKRKENSLSYDDYLLMKSENLLGS